MTLLPIHFYRCQPSPDKSGDLNGSMHPRDEVTSPAIAGAKNVPKNKSNEQASWLGKSERHSKGLVPLKHIVRSDDQRGGASTG
jgi:hypothetical protein